MTATMTRPTISAAPPRSIEQRTTALANANRIRVWRADLKRDLKAGRQSILPLLLDPPADLVSMRVFDLLLAMPRYGRTKVHRLLAVRHISAVKTVGGLSERQRGELVSALRMGGR